MINRLIEDISEINELKGWRDHTDSKYYVPSLIALIHSEASEMLEAYRDNNWEEVEKELADVVIRCLDFAGIFNIDLTSKILDKLEINRKRPYRHGGKVV